MNKKMIIDWIENKDIPKFIRWVMQKFGLIIYTCGVDIGFNGKRAMVVSWSYKWSNVIHLEELVVE